MSMIAELTGLAIAVAIGFQSLQMGSMKSLIKSLIELLKQNSEVNTKLLEHLQQS